MYAFNPHDGVKLHGGARSARKASQAMLRNLLLLGRKTESTDQISVPPEGLCR